MICGASLVAAVWAAQNQAQAQTPKLNLTAALVLTPEFCATVIKKGGEHFKVGQSACNQLEPALKEAFASLTQVDDSAKAGTAQVVLEPKFADVAATQRAFAFSNRELVVLVEWTVRDQAGKVVWLDTVQGADKRHNGNAFTYRSNLKHILEDSIHNMADQSASKMSASPQLQQLSALPVK
jgi:hypothetical protein